MAQETHLSFVGQLTADPQLRWTPQGEAVANFTVATNARFFDKEAREWADRPPLFLRCAAWGKSWAPELAETLRKGVRVVVQGDLEPNEFDTADGRKVSGIAVRVTAIGPDLKRHRVSLPDG